MNRSFIASVLFHLVFIGLAVLGLPKMAERLPIDEPFTVEIVGIPAAPEPTEEPPAPPPAEAAPLPPRQAASPAPPPPAPEPEPEPEPAPESEPAPEPEPEPEPAPEPPQQLATPEPPPPPPAPEPPPPAAEPVPAEVAAPVPPARPRARPTPPKPVETVTPEPPAPEPPAVKVAARPKPPAPPKKAEPSPAPVAKDDDDFAALLRSVEQQNRRVEAPERRPGTGNATEARQAPPAAVAAPVSLSASELAGIRRQIERCWNVPIGVPGIEAMRVSLRIQLEADGSVREVSIEESGRFDADHGFRTVAESARRAVLSCRLDLPAEKYAVWRDMVLTFSPGDALSG